MIKQLLKRLSDSIIHNKYPNIHKTANIGRSAVVHVPENLYMAERTNINKDAIIMNVYAKFIMKRLSGAAVGLTVVTGNHMSIPGIPYKDVTDDVKLKEDTLGELDQDVVVDEDVWIGSHVTLLAGTHVGRGAIVGAGSVVRGSVPPYAIVIGNPAKVVGFRFMPEEAELHEQKILREDESKIPIDVLERNYQMYFLDRRKEILSYVFL